MKSVNWSKPNVKACAMNNHVSQPNKHGVPKTIHSYYVQIDVHFQHTRTRNPLMQKHDRMRKMAYKCRNVCEQTEKTKKKRVAAKCEPKPWPMSQRIGIKLRTGSVFELQRKKTATEKSIKQRNKLAVNEQEREDC